MKWGGRRDHYVDFNEALSVDRLKRNLLQVYTDRPNRDKCRYRSSVAALQMLMLC